MSFFTQGTMASHVFRFEEDFAGDLRCLPMAVRRKLDLAGVKLKLVHWHGLSQGERERLLAWSDDGPSLEALRLWLLERSHTLPQGPAQPLPPATQASWQQVEDVPPALVASCEQLGLSLRPGSWQSLNELQRFALVKLSHPGHEHRNLPMAMGEFGLISDP
ncbi:MAG: nitrate reductase associated protein [Cyanobacteriota bacterium]|nr:nitrate reductase associated protein [Cyanobacteriota bacterium]